MSVGGDRIVDVVPSVLAAWQPSAHLPFIPRRFQAGGRLGVVNGPISESLPFTTCVLCGGLIQDNDHDFEHPLPQWLHRFADDVGDARAPSFGYSGASQPTWRQLCLSSHKTCNKQFARRLEDPVISPIKALVDGGSITSTEVDVIFDWLDKVKAASAHMGTALRGNELLLGYEGVSFPNDRIGMFDRLALFFRVEGAKSTLDLWDCLGEGFLTTPSAIVLQIKDLVIIYVSSNYLLSKPFGLSTVLMKSDNMLEHLPGDGYIRSGLGTRLTRLPIAKILAQPMRRQHMKEGFEKKSKYLQDNGDGKVYELGRDGWFRVKKTNFSNLRKLSYGIGRALAGLETLEWILLCKQLDYTRYGVRGDFFMKSIPSLLQEKRALLELISYLRGGLRVPERDQF